MEGYYPGRTTRSSQRLAGATITATHPPGTPLPPPPQLPHPLPLRLNFPRPVTPRRSRSNPAAASLLLFFLSSFLHLAHFLPGIHPCFGRRAIPSTDTCPPLPPSFCPSSSLRQARRSSIMMAHFPSPDPNLSRVSPGLNNPGSNSKLL